ncbi:hypothetical protein EXS54_00840 [Patescibacteria group bacterium]|nr:hypothetical protein [Patescibacteria group bacterium]
MSRPEYGSEESYATWKADEEAKQRSEVARQRAAKPVKKPGVVQRTIDRFLPHGTKRRTAAASVAVTAAAVAPPVAAVESGATFEKAGRAVEPISHSVEVFISEDSAPGTGPAEVSSADQKKIDANMSTHSAESQTADSSPVASSETSSPVVEDLYPVQPESTEGAVRPEQQINEAASGGVSPEDKNSGSATEGGGVTPDSN